MVNKFWLAPAIAVPIVGALAFSAATPASAMSGYASPAVVSANATSAQPVAYYYHRRHRYYGYGGGAAFADATFGMIAAMAAASSYDDCEWGDCGDYGYGYGYGGPYYGGWGGHRHWGGHHWGGGYGYGWGHHALVGGGGGMLWRHGRR